MKTLKPGDLIELNIDSLSYGGGRGVGRHEGFVFFTPFTAPGDRALVRIDRLKKGFGEATLQKILEPSTARAEPPCPVFGVCGGCKYQHVQYQEQLAQKDQYIAKALRGLAPGKLHSIQPSPNPFFYRNRIQVHVRGEELGFLRMKSDQLVPVTGCWISEEPIHQALGDPDFRKRIFQKNSKKVEIYLSGEDGPHLREVSEIPTHAQFSQVNRFQNEALIRTIVDWAVESVDQASLGHVFDLYAGAGNISFPLFERLKLPVTAVELSENSVRKANERLAPDGSLRFFAQDVGRFLSKLNLKEDLKSALVVLDPPREGLSNQVVESLLEARPSHMIHVGCDLMNFSRDMRKFADAGYEIREIRPLDMFPQTDHVELLAWLVAKH